MTRADALRDLLEKVEAWEWDDVEYNAILAPDKDDIEQAFGPALTSQMYRGWHAYTGSLDAAKALHEAVLPGWAWTAQAEGFCYVYSEQGEHSGIADNSARSWLIAILKTLIATEDN